MAFFVVVEGPLFMKELLIPIPYTWILALFPLTGLIASAWAARCCYRGTNRELIPYLGLAAFAFSAFPGIVIMVGPLGMALTAGALLAHRNQLRREMGMAGPSPA